MRLHTFAAEPTSEPFEGRKGMILTVYDSDRRRKRPLAAHDVSADMVAELTAVYLALGHRPEDVRLEKGYTCNRSLERAA